MRQYVLLSLVLVYSVSMLKAQSVGINKTNPIAALDIFTTGNTGATRAVKIENSFGTQIFGLSDEANIGINKSSVNIRLDMRGSGADNSIGLGTTTLSAAAAQGGAIRYQPVGNYIEYSDGNEWYYLKTTEKRACIIYVNNNNAGNIPDNTLTILGGWTSAYDPNGYFNPANGTFTAPKNGIYYTILSFGFVPANGHSGCEVEAQWMHYRNGVLINSAKAKTAYTFGGIMIRQAICYASFLLEKGDVLRPAAWHNTGISQTLMTGVALGGNGGFNYLSVIIQ